MHLGLSGCCLCFVPLKNWRQEWTQAFPLQLRPSPHGCGQPDAVPGWLLHPVSFSALCVQPGWQQWPPITTETASAQAKEGPCHAAERLLWGCECLPVGHSQGIIDWRLATGKEETGLLGYWCTDFRFLRAPWQYCYPNIFLIGINPIVCLPAAL